MSCQPFLKHLPVFILLSAVTGIMSWPAILNLTHSIIGDAADSLFNAWILAWDVHKILSGEWLTLFNANIFYPHANTLAYSENMLGNTIWALPIIAISNNPVLAYNLVFLIGLFLSAFCTYLLVFDLTKSRYAGVVSGLIFGFFPWRFARAAHVQLQVTQWIPLAFLFLHRFLKDGSYKNILLFTFFFVLQFYSCGYYGLYLTLFVGLLLILTLFQRNYSFGPLAFPLGLFVIISVLCILPVYYPYVQVKQEMGFSRPLQEVIYFSPDLLNYLSTMDINRVWGGLTQPLWMAEGELFLGVTAISLGVLGIFSSLKRKGGRDQDRYPVIERKIIKIFMAFINGLIIFCVLVGLFIFISGGISTTFLGIKISARDLERPLEFLLLLGGLKLLLERITRGHFPRLKFSFDSPVARFYSWVLLLSFLLSLGPVIHSHGKQIFHYGPYTFLYQYIPGFDGLRVPGRFIVLFALGLSVLAGYGMVNLLNRTDKPWGKILIAGTAASLILLEYASFPIPMVRVPTGQSIPGVYHWLARQKGDFPILELPLPGGQTSVWLEARRLYFSTIHWKKLVNGYSGYFPSDYDFLYQKGLKGFPTKESVDLIKKREIKYLIIHFDEYENQEKERIWGLLKDYEGSLRLVTHFENDFIYELTGNEPVSSGR